MAWSGAKPRSVANASLLVRIRESFALSGRTYGSRRHGSADVVSTCYCEAEAGRALGAPLGRTLPRIWRAGNGAAIMVNGTLSRTIHVLVP